jgi:hypothetical protein
VKTLAIASSFEEVALKSCHATAKKDLKKNMILSEEPAVRDCLKVSAHYKLIARKCATPFSFISTLNLSKKMLRTNGQNLYRLLFLTLRRIRIYLVRWKYNKIFRFIFIRSCNSSFTSAIAKIFDRIKVLSVCCNLTESGAVEYKPPSIMREYLVQLLEYKRATVLCVVYYT